ncbi:unnamed protein product, partial [Staurois parvus]
MSQRSQGPEPGRRMPASAGGDSQGRCRGHIVGAQDKVSDRGNPRATLQGNPECSSWLPLLALIINPELHSRIPPGRLMAQSLSCAPAM